MPETPRPREAPTVGALFRGFLGLGLLGFGGVLPLARDLIVERRRWLDAAEFTDLLGLCQFLPGGNVINLSVALGLRFRGVPGALAALGGLIAAPTIVVVGLGALYDRFHDDPHVRHLFAGLAAAAAGLLVAAAVKIAEPLIAKPLIAEPLIAEPLRGRPVGIGVALVCVLAVAAFRLPLLPVLLVLAPASVLATRWAVRGAGR